ncbi:DUF2218 domain-containing protein [Paracoccus sp. S3-43]|uniref:DUF2218 domain-containing protein n=1 Tax=Paracoccus sp. S3-43 TaxID=3030011 RepID=UPI0023B0E17D|nr:DUF2218 domain-containing protein [Paracoccus sp. S3-43]WEF24493.1 DUF2218 domain-containing protein [Paracoccus sp. S3-43]
MTNELSSTGRFATGQAHRYMVQLCKHFAHKIPAEVEGDAGSIRFDLGTARLTASQAELTCVVAGADTAAVATLQDIIDRHLARFAFREGFANMDWSPAA